MHGRRFLTVLATAAACAAVGCGGDDEDGGGGGGNGGGSGASEEAAVKQGLTDYAKAIEDNDPAAACDGMTEKAQEDAKETVPGSDDCESAHRVVLTAVGEKRGDLSSQLDGADFTVTIDGDTAEMTSPKAPGRPLKMRRVDGEWKLDQNTLTYRPNQ